MAKSLIDIIWADLDRVVDMIMESDDLEIDDPELNRAKGRCEGLSYALAVLIQSPVTPDINPIRERAMERWEARHPEQE